MFNQTLKRELTTITHTSLKFGSWPSPLSAETVAGKSLRFGLLQSLKDYIYWTECRPNEQGRCVIVRQKLASTNSTASSLQAQDLLPPPFSARSSVHEYGGGEFLVSSHTLYFINAEDQQIYSISIDSNSQSPVQITHAAHYRFTDICLDTHHNRLICACEIHDKNAPHPKNCLAQINLAEQLDQRISILVDGHDFYANPRLSPDGKKLSWLSWNLPNMPWESATLHVGQFDETGSLFQIEQIAGDGTNCVFQPEWHQDGSLFFIWDQSGWGNLYRWPGTVAADRPTCILSKQCDFGQPQWVFGMKKYALLENNTIALAFTCQGETKTAIFNPQNQQLSELSQQDTSVTSIEQLVATPNGFAGLTLKHKAPQSITEINVMTGATSVLRQGADCNLDPDDISAGQNIAFKNQKGEDVFGIFYPPTNGSYQGLEATLPPCIFNVHGGPTAAASRGLNLKIQYWTTRGFAWCDIDYSGSTGYGKDYRKRLDGQWGIADVADLESAAHYLITQNKIDKNACIITGSSAGGLTVLNALANSDTFCAGASYYGVTDLLKLHNTTHKFEAGYLLSLIGCTEKNYQDILPKRSPLTIANKISAPVIFFQGTKDAVVPLEQAETMSKALQAQNIPTELFVFEGEGHGFRKKETIITALKQEYQFYQKILKLSHSA